MFRKKDTHTTPVTPVLPVERVTTVLGSGTTFKGSLSGSGGARIEGAFEGEVNLSGMIVIGATGRVTCPHVKANVVIVAGALRGDITAEKVEIRSSGRVWGNVITSAFSTEEGAFLRGQIQMEERVEMGPLLEEKPAVELQPFPGDIPSVGRIAAGQQDASRDLPPASPPVEASQQTRPVQLPWDVRNGTEVTRPTGISGDVPDESQGEGES